MSISTELSQYWQDRFVVLILDNEVTLEHFVTEPALPWARMVHSAGDYRVAEGYPKVLDGNQAKHEMKNWDQVNPGGIGSVLERREQGVDCFVVGNNAGQGLPMASVLDNTRRATEAVVILAPTDKAFLPGPLDFVQFVGARGGVEHLPKDHCPLSL